MHKHMNGLLTDLKITARGKEILAILEDIRLYLMDLVMRKREAMNKKQWLICPKVQAKLEELKRISHELGVNWNSGNQFELHGHGARFKADLRERTCGCNRWQLSGIPCVYGVDGIVWLKQDVESCGHRFYTKRKYLKIYSNLLMPLNVKDL